MWVVAGNDSSKRPDYIIIAAPERIYGKNRTFVKAVGKSFGKLQAPRKDMHCCY